MIISVSEMSRMRGRLGIRSEAGRNTVLLQKIFHFRHIDLVLRMAGMIVGSTTIRSLMYAEVTHLNSIRIHRIMKCGIILLSAQAVTGFSTKVQPTIMTLTFIMIILRVMLMAVLSVWTPSPGVHRPGPKVTRQRAMQDRPRPWSLTPARTGARIAGSDTASR